MYIASGVLIKSTDDLTGTHSLSIFGSSYKQSKLKLLDARLTFYFRKEILITLITLMHFFTNFHIIN